MARMPSNPALLILYANYLIEARKDGQAARTQLQLAQKANPSILDNYNIYVVQQLAKQLKRGGSQCAVKVISWRSCLHTYDGQQCCPVAVTLHSSEGVYH